MLFLPLGTILRAFCSTHLMSSATGGEEGNCTVEQSKASTLVHATLRHIASEKANLTVRLQGQIVRRKQSIFLATPLCPMASSMRATPSIGIITTLFKTCKLSLLRKKLPIKYTYRVKFTDRYR
jgi:hypothetical protein